MWHSSDIGVYGFSMALYIDYLHNLGTLFSVRHLLSISSNQLCKVGLYLIFLFYQYIIYASSSSVLGCCYSMPAALLFLGAAIFPVFFSENGYTNVTSPVASVCCTECLGLLDMVP